MARRPKVERDPLTGGLTYQSAARWYRFLADEALFEEGDAFKSDRYLVAAGAMETGPQGTVYSKTLEEAIAKWEKNDEQDG